MFLCFSEYFTNNYEAFWARERYIDGIMSRGLDRITAANIVDKYVLTIYVLHCCYHCVMSNMYRAVTVMSNSTSSTV